MSEPRTSPPRRGLRWLPLGRREGGHPPGIRHMRPIILAAALAPLLLGGALAACDDAADHVSKLDECGADLTTEPKIGGPLGRDTGVLEFGMNDHYRSADVGMLVLNVPNGKTVVIDHVQFEDDEEFAPLRLVKTFVVEDDEGEGMTQTPVGEYPARLQSVKCFRLEHHITGLEPYLVFRVAVTPGKPSRNKTIDIIYHTPDGQRYVSVWLYQIYFPNKPSRPEQPDQLPRQT